MKKTRFSFKAQVNHRLLSTAKQIWVRIERIYLLFQQHWIEIMLIVTFVGIIRNQYPTLSLSMGRFEIGAPNSYAEPMNTSLLAERNQHLQNRPIASDNTTIETTKLAESNVPELDEKRIKQKAYVSKYANIAIKEMEEHGVPASITLAQGLLESNIGESSLATRNNNHFGIKCFSRKCQKGHCSNFEDDSHKDFFRIFESAEASYRQHSQFLHKDRYKHLFDLDRSDYKGWAHGLKKAGYATDPRYAYKLIALIENLGLYEYDDIEN